jgi:natural product precursor
MKKIERPKLKLLQETVRALESADFKAIIGGNNPPSNRTDCKKTC